MGPPSLLWGRPWPPAHPRPAGLDHTAAGEGGLLARARAAMRDPAYQQVIQEHARGGGLWDTKRALLLDQVDAALEQAGSAANGESIEAAAGQLQRLQGAASDARKRWAATVAAEHEELRKRKAAGHAPAAPGAAQRQDSAKNLAAAAAKKIAEEAEAAKRKAEQRAIEKQAQLLKEAAIEHLRVEFAAAPACFSATRGARLPKTFLNSYPTPFSTSYSTLFSTPELAAAGRP